MGQSTVLCVATHRYVMQPAVGAEAIIYTFRVSEECSGCDIWTVIRSTIHDP